MKRKFGGQRAFSAYFENVTSNIRYVIIAEKALDSLNETVCFLRKTAGVGQSFSFGLRN